MSQASTFFFSCCRGVESILFQELQGFLGSDEHLEQQNAGVLAEVSLEKGLELTFRTLLAERAYVLLDEFEIESTDDFQQALSDLPWTDYMHSSSTFRFQVKGLSGKDIPKDMQNTLYLAQLAKDCVVDGFEGKRIVRPSVDLKHADLRYFLYFEKAEAKRMRVRVYLDLKGRPLTKRGYRLEGGLAPVREGIGAAAAFFSGLAALQDFSRPIFDYFCGSGTLLFEAGLMLFACPGQYRLIEKKKSLYDWSFLHFFPIKDAKSWVKPLEQVRAEFEKAKRSAQNAAKAGLQVTGLDVNEEQLTSAKKNLERFPLERSLFDFRKGDFFESVPPQAGVGLSNLPFGKRLESQNSDLDGFYYDVGEHLKAKFKGSSYTLYSEGPAHFKAVRLKPDKKLPIQNGQLETQLRLFSLF